MLSDSASGHTAQRLAPFFGGLLVGRVGAIALQAIAFGLTARSVGPRLFGPIAAATGLMAFLTVLADSGLNSAAIREMAANPLSSIWSQMIHAKLYLAAIASLAWILVTALVAWIGTPHVAVLMPLGIYFFCDVMSESLMSRDIAFARPATPSANLLLRRSTAVIFTLLLLPRLGVLALTSGLALGSMCGLVVAVRQQRRYLTPSNKAMSLRELLDTARPYWLTSLASQVQNLDNFIVVLIAGPFQAGLYGAPARILGPMGVIASTFASTVMPLTARGHTPRALFRATLYLLCLCGIAFAAFAVLGNRLVSVTVGSGFRGSVAPMQWLLLGLWISTANQPLVGYLQGSGYAKNVARVLVVAAPVGLIAAALGCWFDGATGAAAGVVAVQSTICIGLVQTYLRTNPKAVSGSRQPEPDILQSLP